MHDGFSSRQRDSVPRSVGHLGKVGEVDRGGVAPQALEPVELPSVFDEDVNDEVDVVHQNPFAGAQSLDVRGTALQLPAQALLDRPGDRDDLPIRVAVANDEVVGEVAETAEVKNDEILGLLVECGLDAVGDLWRNPVDQRAFSRR